MTFRVLPVIVLLITSCKGAPQQQPVVPASQPGAVASPARNLSTEKAPEPGEGLEVATFAGGCFWCMEPPFEKLEGVDAVLSGFTGGTEQGPSYKEVAYGKTSHLESVHVYFDPKIVSYEKLLEVFWMNIDPTDDGGQFVDRGHHYTTAIFFHSEEQKKAAEASKAELGKRGIFDGEIVTAIRPASDFWVAEDYHQDFYKKDPDHYHRYRSGSGRDRFIAKHWK